MKTIIRSPAMWAMLTVFIIAMGCSFWQEMNEDSTKAKAAIESEFGCEVEIGWNWENGKITSVDVHFVKSPKGEINLEQLNRRVTSIVKENFRRSVQEVNISI
jgi:hypothetical protein